MFSARDNLSLWVIGPSIGQFIAGIRQVLIMIVLFNQIKKIIIQEFSRGQLCSRTWLWMEVNYCHTIAATIGDHLDGGSPLNISSNCFQVCKQGWTLGRQRPLTFSDLLQVEEHH